MADTPPGGTFSAPPSPPAPPGGAGYPPSPPGGAGVPPAPPPTGGSAPAMPGRRRPGWLRYVVLAGVILLIAGCAVFMLFTLGQSLGAEALLIGLVAAILPVPVLIACFLWLDRYEPEPLKYLIFCFAWGAFVSTAASINVNGFFADRFQEWGLPDALVAVLVAPFIEELTKALGPVLLFVFRRREWSGITDGLVYCGLSAVGFAMVENILYLGGHGYASGVEQYGPATGAQNLIAIFMVRILLFGMAHPMFTAMTGIGLGIAARTADRRVRVLAPLAGLLLAMMLHGTWNLLPSLTVATGQALISLYGYIGVMTPIFFALVGLAVWLRGWEGRLTERVLPDYVRAGWLTPPEVAALGSLGRRHAARQWARRVGGDAGLKAMRGYQFAATRLALLRDGMRRGLDDRPADRDRALREERELLDSTSTYRSFFVGRDPQTPVGIWDGQRYHLTFPDGSRRPVDPPDEPVVPIPVVLGPPRPVGPPAPFPPPGPYGAAPYPGAGQPPWGAAPPPGPWRG
ncbi:PrsW family intramembrane metalloprotease [Micromonospora echinofusca]|uniref:PrsW family intramembrane metalloprotease n=1 Tax=Micromonospora echinofusca TaxID=47858 RepID=A0ABS3W0K7_MICEH|nr:PrsW family intramembrane metalloprotease [Micromonospora echinofusca]MBO4210325.1 PrsW family intramembrane metalloprotease [Micromonospora echinofusca]